MAEYAEIVVNIPSIRGVFHYTIPANLKSILNLGHYVKVPFGNQLVQGVVIALSENSPVSETKTIIDLIDPDPVLNPTQIKLAKKLSLDTHNSLAAIVNLFLPTGLANQTDVLYSIAEIQEPVNISESQKKLLSILRKKGPLRGRQIDRALPNREWRRTIPTLLRNGILISQSILPPPRVRPKFIRVAQLAVTPDIATEAMNDLGNTANTQKRRKKAIQFLMKEPEAVNVSWVYAESGCNLGDLQVLADKELIVLFETEIWRDPISNIKPVLETSPQLTNDQSKVWREIQKGINKLAIGEQIRPYLLHGVTGSGKTEIYLQAVNKVIRSGKTAIVMVPEISLTPQTVRRFLARFPGQVGLVHSRLSEGERYDTWRRARSSKLKVIIGPRSALFSPLPNLGVIILDEFHDQSYYQEETPCYDALQAAIISASLNQAVCILGSATPPIAKKYFASLKPPKFDLDSEGGRHQFQLLELPSRLTPMTDGSIREGTPLPQVELVDMREELKAGNREIFSRSLDSALEATLKKEEQAILFLNRRGTASYVFCRDCGISLNCPNCSSSLTYHTRSPKYELLCHRCGFSIKMPKLCPTCNSTAIRKYGLGSEQVEKEVQERFPSARTLRWDHETTREKGSHEIILSHFISQRSNVLIGTQMLAKGLDLPKVTLVGIILADVGLNLPDPFAAERNFQVLTQVAGRAGRSELGGKVIMQTFQPEHYSIQAAAYQDYESFYQREIIEREKLGNPPFNRLVRLEYHHVDNQKVITSMQGMVDYLNSRIISTGKTETEVLGPLPCFHEKVNNQFRWQVILRGPNPTSLLPTRFLEGWKIEIDPPNLL